MKLELHQLEHKHGDLRVVDRTRDERLLSSMSEHGQQTPIVVVSGCEDRFILLDGYARVRALTKLARDEVEAVVLELPEAEALVLSQRLDNARPRTALEDGWMLQVLLDDHGLSQGELADKLDRSTSWV